MPCQTLDELPAPPPGRTGWPWTEGGTQVPEAIPAGSSWPRVSIVTPSFNQGPFIEETIRSVLLQGYPNLEYIIMDGGSSDDSVDIIRKYEDHLDHWTSEPDRGQADAINKGLCRATGDILGWLNSDDTLEPDTVTRAVAYLASTPEVDVVYGTAFHIDSQSNLIASRAPKAFQDFGLHSILDECKVTQPGAFWRRRIQERVGLLDETLHYVLDYELWVRMALAGGQFRYLAGRPVANFRLSERSKTASQLDRSGMEKLQVLDRLLDDPALPEKLHLSPREVSRQERRARALASLKIYLGYSMRKKTGRLAWHWLGQALRLHPALLIERWRPVLGGFRNMLRAYLQR